MEPSGSLGLHSGSSHTGLPLTDTVNNKLGPTDQTQTEALRCFQLSTRDTCLSGAGNFTKAVDTSLNHTLVQPAQLRHPTIVLMDHLGISTSIDPHYIQHLAPVMQQGVVYGHRCL